MCGCICSSIHLKLGAARGAICVLALSWILGALLGPGASVASAQPFAREAPAAEADADHPFARRIPAPDLTGGAAWINTAGPIEMKDLRGKFVLLDFWTYCCINCMHILPELKKLEEMFPNELVVIGVHSAKFENEEDSKNIAEAVMRNEIKHPVVNDAKHAIWDRFQARSWPTMYLIDPEGNVVYGRNGEFKAAEIEAVIRRALPYYKKKGKLDTTPLRFELEADRATPTPLRFPGKVLADEKGKRLFIADSNHNRIVIAGLDGALLDIIGAGTIGSEDGDFATASFNHPQGMALNGNTLYVADTENHMLRKIDLVKKRVFSIAGSGHQAKIAWPGVDLKALSDGGPVKWPERFVGKPKETELNSPWDLLIHNKDLFIAMAGPHQIWRMPLSESEIGPFAGNGREDIVDGPMLPKEPYEEGYSSFAQPSGLATDGKSLYVADSEGSSIRVVPFNPAQPVSTLLGTAGLEQFKRLFTFGDQDGAGDDVKFQHLLGVAWQDGKLYVADTYNNKIKVVEPSKKTAKTIAGNGKPGHADGAAASFDEPAGISAADGKLYVADTNNHLIRTIDLKNNEVATFEIAGLTPPKLPEETPAEPDADSPRVEVAPVTLKPTDGLVWLTVKLQLPDGWELNKQAPMRYKITTSAQAGPVHRAKINRYQKVDPLKEFQIEVPLAATTGEEPIEISLDYFYCRKGAEGVCKAGTVRWAVPLKVDAKAKASKAPIDWTVPQ